MKKTKQVFGLLLFLFCFSFLFCDLKVTLKSYATENNHITQNINYEFFYGEKFFKFSSNEIISNLELTSYKKELLKSNQNRYNIYKVISKLGFSKSEALCYAYPELQKIVIELQKQINVKALPNDIQVVCNKCEIKFTKEKHGRFLNTEKFFDDLEKQLATNQTNIKINLIVQEYSLSSDLKSNYVEKGCFSTNFQSSSAERKNNIKKALSSFDGLVLNEGEVFSFNSVTGERSQNNGYKPAKIISGGTFVEGYGGGVCQVSTTIYNACLIAGLEILEVHQHSLPVGYVEPSFDAMVNTGSSDLVVRNNTNGKLIFTTSSENDICKVKIFGKKNLYKISRFSEKTKTIPASEDVVETDLKKYNIENLEIGEQKRISFAKDGYESVGYLKFYDDKGVLIKTQKIRENKYAPTKGVVVVREK